MIMNRFSKVFGKSIVIFCMGSIGKTLNTVEIKYCSTANTSVDSMKGNQVQSISYMVIWAF